MVLERMQTAQTASEATTTTPAMTRAQQHNHARTVRKHKKRQAMLSEKAKRREQEVAAATPQYGYDPYGDDPETDDDAIQLPDSTIALFEVLDLGARGRPIPLTLLAVASGRMPRTSVTVD